MEIKPISIFNSKCDFLVNTINTKGAMGKGLALEFRLRVPKMYSKYVIKCRNKEIKVGKYWVYRDYERICKNILNFPTKKHFAHPSKPEYLIEGLKYFRRTYIRNNISSIAFPLMGAKNGKLNPIDSVNIMFDYLNDLPIDIEICEGRLEDEFTKYIKDFFITQSVDELFDSTQISEHYLKKIKLNIHKIRFITELVSNDIIPVRIAERIYDYVYHLRAKEFKLLACT